MGRRAAKEGGGQVRRGPINGNEAALWTWRLIIKSYISLISIAEP